MENKRIAEEALQESEDRLRTIFNSVQAGIVIIDVEKHTIADVNSIAAKMIGSTRDEDGRDSQELVERGGRELHRVRPEREELLLGVHERPSAGARGR